MKPVLFLTAILTMLSAGGCGFQAPAQNTPHAGVAGSGDGNRMAPQQGGERAVNLPGAGSGTEGNLRWVNYQDPLEQAFTIEGPSGWNIQAGMFRIGYQDVRPMIDITSPDRQVNIRIGDVSVPTYFVPNQFHGEGEVDDLGASGQGRFARYRSGKQFAESYAEVRFARVCESLTLEQTTLPPITKPDSPQGSDEATEGEITLACASPQGERTAYVYAQTALSQNAWQVTNLASYIAPPDQVALARSIIVHVAGSLHGNPSWAQYQAQMAREGMQYQELRQQQRRDGISRQMQQFEAKMQGMQNQVEAFERGQTQRNEQFKAFDDIIVGITPTIDPMGNEVDVTTGPNSGYWRNGAGDTANSDNMPGPGWQRLTIKHQ
jgi:hypothetical protein